MDSESFSSGSSQLKNLKMTLKLQRFNSNLMRFCCKNTWNPFMGYGGYGKWLFPLANHFYNKTHLLHTK